MKIGFLGLLTLLFIGLKLTGAIGWTWIWVLSPIWLPILVVPFMAIIAIIGAALGDLIIFYFKAKKRR